ncbi:MAG: deoxycytidylate deaminase [Planctomycetota bacterium]
MNQRPDWDHYYMHIAEAVRARAECCGRKVGAILVKENRIIATGYNGVPAGMPNCTSGGCLRCNQPDRFPPGHGYDLCICVHAEQNALLMAARFGIAVAGATCYSTLQPCFGCAKEMLQAGVQRVLYGQPWLPNDPDTTMQALKREQYERILGEFAAVEMLAVADHVVSEPQPPPA